MKRRELLLLLGGAMTTAPHALRAQQKAMPVVGFLTGGALDPAASPGLTAFRQGLSEAGHVVGQNVTIEYRGARVALIGCPHWPSTSSAARSI